MSRGEDLFFVYLLVAFLSWIPYTALFGGLPEKPHRYVRWAFTVWQVAWAVMWLWIWRHP